MRPFFSFSAPIGIYVFDCKEKTSWADSMDRNSSVHIKEADESSLAFKILVVPEKLKIISV